jgi:hypothetical protein
MIKLYAGRAIWHEIQPSCLFHSDTVCIAPRNAPCERPAQRNMHDMSVFMIPGYRSHNQRKRGCGWSHGARTVCIISSTQLQAPCTRLHRTDDGSSGPFDRAPSSAIVVGDVHAVVAARPARFHCRDVLYRIQPTDSFALRHNVSLV